jgi:hypothetical protein
MLNAPRCALALCLLALAAGCVATVVDRQFPAMAERRAPIRKVAVAPLGAKPEAAAVAAPLVSRYLADALAARGLEVVAPEDVARSVSADPNAGVRELAAQVQQQFGADAVLLGEITRWVEREGEPLGTLRPASVGLHVVLHGAPGGERLWEGDFDRTQQALLENVLLTPRYPGGGMSWLSADEFARFAADELAAALPVSK